MKRDTATRIGVRRVLKTLTVLTAGVLLAAGCSGGAKSSESQNQVLRVGLSNEPPPLQAGKNQGTAALQLTSLIHRGLLQRDTEGLPTEALAESYEVVDPTTYRFSLRPGLKFHDGQQLTSTNAKRTLEYLADPKNGARILNATSSIESIETPDDLTLLIRLKSPNAAFLEYLADPTGAILPDSALKPDAENTVGAGPFQLTRYDEGVKMVFSPFADYYDADSVSLDEIEVAFYPDGNARTNALRNGTVDLIDYVPWENFESIEADPRLVLDSQLGPFSSLLFNVTKGPLAKAKVREAIAYAIDRDKVRQVAYSGTGEVIGGMPIAKESPFYVEARENTWKLDLGRARQLMAEAGYSNGFNATILATSQYTFFQDAALTVQEDLKKIGINLKLDSPDYATYVQKASAGKYDIAASGTSALVNDPSFLGDLLTGPAAYTRSYGYSDPTMEKLLSEGVQATSQEERAQIYDELLRRVATEVPFVTMTKRAQAYAYDKKVKGFANLPGYATFSSFYTMTDTSIE